VITVEKPTPVVQVVAPPVVTSIQSAGNVATAEGKEPAIAGADALTNGESGPKQAGVRRSTERKRKKT
jgi:hypothetical protein